LENAVGENNIELSGRRELKIPVPKSPNKRVIQLKPVRGQSLELSWSTVSQSVRTIKMKLK